MVFFRNFIFTHFDKKLLTHRAVIPYVEVALIAVIIISVILAIIAVTPRPAQGRYTLSIITGLQLALSLCWSLSNYCFIFFWTLPFARPLLVILMTTGLAALYHHWPGIIAFMLPLWGTALLAGIQNHPHTEVRFLILWGIFTAILLYGRRILKRWYDEARRRIRKICGLFSGWKVLPTRCINRDRESPGAECLSGGDLAAKRRWR